MVNIKQRTKDALSKKYPHIDLTYFDKIYDEIGTQILKAFGERKLICYNKRCKNRMV